MEQPPVGRGKAVWHEGGCSVRRNVTGNTVREVEARSPVGGTNDKPELGVLFVYHSHTYCPGKSIIFESKL